MNVLIPLFSLRRFSFTGLAPTLGLEVPMVRAIETSGFREIALIVRVHARTIDTGGSIAVEVKHVSRTPEEPGIDFVGPLLLSASIPAGTTPVLFEAAAATTFGCLVRIGVTGTRGASGAVTADLAADLLLKE